MPQPADKKENVKILQDIYANQNSDQTFAGRDTFKATVKEYFSKPGVTDRWIAGGILFFGLVAVVLGLVQFKYNLVSNFKKSAGTAIGLNKDNLNNPDLLGLRQKDTDLDGLSDYDELSVYKTSPYLKDSDSDGISDANEIAKGTDPNCKAGENCFGTFVNDQTTPAVTAGAVQPDNVLLSGALTGPQIRQLLLKAGFSSSELTDVSDVELAQLYQQILAETEGGVNQAPNTVSIQGDIEKLTPDQIRDLMEKEGIQRSTLDSMSDAELMALVKETLAGQ